MARERPTTDVQGIERRWLETLLDELPLPTVLIETGTGTVTFANRAADALAGGHFPRGAAPDRNEGEFGVFTATGRRLMNDELPSTRAARGERIDREEIDWRTPAGTHSLLIHAATLPQANGEPETVMMTFDDVGRLKHAEHEKAESLAQLDALFASSPIGLAYLDRELRYRRINEKLALEINGLPVEDHIGMTPQEVLPEMDQNVMREFRHVLESGRMTVGMEFVGATPATSGERRRYSTSIYPVRDRHGEITGVGAVVLDITARARAEAELARALELEREAAARARFLAEASRILDESLDYESTLATVSRLVVPWLADWCTIDMPAQDGSIRRVATAHVDQRKVELARDWDRRHPIDPSATAGVPQVLRSGRPEIYPEISPQMIEASARDGEHLDLLRSLQLRSVMIVPMVARGRTLGSITFVSTEEGRRYGDDDLALAEELARRAATSVDNSRLYGERSYIARTLQQSLLPPHLPDIERLDIAALYRPAGEGNEVGGDFYDVFETGPGAWSVVIGDVCGKGADAAALTALVRYTVRAIADGSQPPSEILRRLNGAILRQRSDNRFCTVAYARVRERADGVSVALSNGGHPLPLVLRADGTAESIGEPGTLLGVVPDPTLVDSATELDPGDTLVLYTDGITEAAAPARLLECDDLVAALKGCDGHDPSALSACLERLAVEASGGRPADDIAIVVLQVAARA